MPVLKHTYLRVPSLRGPGCPSFYPGCRGPGSGDVVGGVRERGWGVREPSRTVASYRNRRELSQPSRATVGTHPPHSRRPVQRGTVLVPAGRRWHSFHPPSRKTIPPPRCRPVRPGRPFHPHSRWLYPCPPRGRKSLKLTYKSGLRICGRSPHLRATVLGSKRIPKNLRHARPRRERGAGGGKGSVMSAHVERQKKFAAGGTAGFRLCHFARAPLRGAVEHVPAGAKILKPCL